MRRLAGSVILILLATGGGAQSASAVPRTMLLETFTNTSCLPCVNNNPVVHDFLTAYGPALAVGVQYHVSWPGATDPFYLQAPTEALTRAAYYAVSGLPTNVADGGRVGTGSYAPLEAAASDRLLTDSPFALAVTHSVAGGQVNVTVTVNAVGIAPAGSLTLRVALVETEVHYATPPGANGETDFHDSMRRMMPDAGGTSLVIAHGEQEVFNLSTPLVDTWNPANLRAVTWIQQEATQEVLQSSNSAVAPAYAFYFGTRAVPDVVPLGTMKTFTSLLINAGAASDTYDLHIAQALPPGWTGCVCVGSTCYPPWITDIAVTRAPGAVDTVLVDVTPALTSGTGTVTVTATSRADPSNSWTRTYRVISSGVPVLCVNADGGHGFETWYAAALDVVTDAYATWDRAAHGTLTATQLANFQAVVWNADLAYPPLTAGDMAALGAYLDGGGRLFISGQDVGWALCAAGSPYATTESRAWYARYLGADFVADDSGIYSLYGETGDPIGGGLSFAIDGGTGSGQQGYPDEIQPRTGAEPVFFYSSGREGAIRYDNGTFKVVYLGYGFQAQATLSSRMTVMSRALRWFDLAGPVDVPGGEGPAALAEPAPRAAPNPFRPSTRISFVVGGSAPLPVSVAIYDVSGRRLRALWEGPAAPGPRTLVWDGCDEHGAHAASGVFLARVTVGAERRTLKLVLAE